MRDDVDLLFESLYAPHRARELRTCIFIFIISYYIFFTFLSSATIRGPWSYKH